MADNYTVAASSNQIAIEAHMRRHIDLSVAVAPHHMHLVGNELEATAPGAGGRADVILLTWPMGAEEPTALRSWPARPSPSASGEACQDLPYGQGPL